MIGFFSVLVLSAEGSGLVCRLDDSTKQLWRKFNQLQIPCLARSTIFTLIVKIMILFCLLQTFSYPCCQQKSNVSTGKILFSARFCELSKRYNKAISIWPPEPRIKIGKHLPTCTVSVNLKQFSILFAVHLTALFSPYVYIRRRKFLFGMTNVYSKCNLYKYCRRLVSQKQYPLLIRGLCLSRNRWGDQAYLLREQEMDFVHFL